MSQRTPNILTGVYSSRSSNLEYDLLVIRTSLVQLFKGVTEKKFLFEHILATIL